MTNKKLHRFCRAYRCESALNVSCARPAGLLSAVDMVEVNPLRGQSDEDVRSTVSTAVDLLLGCFGRLREGNHSPDYRLPEP